jgi:hypothetical protein
MVPMHPLINERSLPTNLNVGQAFRLPYIAGMHASRRNAESSDSAARSSEAGKLLSDVAGINAAFP